MFVFRVSILAVFLAHCTSFSGRRSSPRKATLRNNPSETMDGSTANITPLDPKVAQQFTIQVCTATSCCRKMNELGLDKYHTLGEIYAKAQEGNIETSMIIEDGGCQGGKNCKLGPCVAILHEDFDGNVALDGMGSAEFRERV